MELQVLGSAPSVDTGTRLNYTAQVQNLGPAQATSVTLTYVVPSGAVFEEVSGLKASSCTTPAVGTAGAITCDLGTMGVGLSHTLTIGVTPRIAGTLSSEFRVTSQGPDPAQVNNVQTVATTVTTAPAVLTILENIFVSDSPVLRPSAMIQIVESIHVSDAPAVLPSALIQIVEQIHVDDAPVVRPSAMFTVNEVITVIDAPTVVAPQPQDTTPPLVTVPPNLTVRATGPTGAEFFWLITALDNVSGPLVPVCNPAMGATLPIGTTTVTCTAVDGAGNIGTGSFTVTVIVGVPKVSMTIFNKGRDATGYFVDLVFVNTGTGDSPLMTVSRLTFKTLSGTGTVIYSPQSMGPLPMQNPDFEAGGTVFGRLYLQVPATVTRFSITMSGTFTNALGATSTFSFGQTVIP
jgi:uncharacterized repeat protein (TIGR01451 family)